MLLILSAEVRPTEVWGRGSILGVAGLVLLIVVLVFVIRVTRHR